jgi:polygalacturonase
MSRSSPVAISAIFASGADNLTLDHLKIDTNRHVMNVDCCRNVRISGCSVNSPSDDGICLKSSCALGEARAAENVIISDCCVTGGWQVGTMMDGIFKRFTNTDPGEPTGRIKCGTESNGGFRNIAIGKGWMANICREADYVTWISLTPAGQGGEPGHQRAFQ